MKEVKPIDADATAIATAVKAEVEAKAGKSFSTWEPTQYATQVLHLTPSIHSSSLLQPARLIHTPLYSYISSSLMGSTTSSKSRLEMMRQYTSVPTKASRIPSPPCILFSQARRCPMSWSTSSCILVKPIHFNQRLHPPTTKQHEGSIRYSHYNTFSSFL